MKMMNINNLTALLSVPAMVLASHATVVEEMDKTILQLESAGKHACELLGEFNETTSGLLSPELEMRLAVFDFILNRLNKVEPSHISIDYKRRILESVKKVFSHMLADTAWGAVKKEAEANQGFRDVLKRLVNSQNQCFSRLMSEAEVMIDNLAQQLPESYSQFDKDVLVLQHIGVDCAKLLCNLKVEDAEKPVAELKLLCEQMEILLSRLESVPEKQMSEEAARHYFSVIGENSELLSQCMEGAGGFQDKLVSLLNEKSDFSTQLLQYFALISRVTEFYKNDVIADSLELLCMLEAEIEPPYSEFEKALMLWNLVTAKYVESLIMISESPIAETAEALKVCNDASEQLLATLAASELEVVSESVYNQIDKINENKQKLVDGTSAEIQDSLLEKMNAASAECEAFRMQQERRVRLMQQMEQNVAIVRESEVHSLISGLEATLPGSFTQFDKDMLVLQQIILLDAKVIASVGDMDKAEAFAELRLNNAAGLRVAERLQAAPDHAMSVDAAWHYMSIQSDIIPLFKAAGKVIDELNTVLGEDEAENAGLRREVMRAYLVSELPGKICPDLENEEKSE